MSREKAETPKANADGRFMHADVEESMFQAE